MKVQLFLKQCCYVGVLLASVILSLCAIVAGVQILFEESPALMLGIWVLWAGTEIIVSNFITLFFFFMKEVRIRSK